MSQPVFRFAPSPNGELHLGHALSALLNYDLAQRLGGRFLLRIEDIDTTRCRPEFEAAIYRDLAWLGLHWEEPVRRQSDHFDGYRAALSQLEQRRLTFLAFESRAELKALQQSRTDWPTDPDGAPLYGGNGQSLSADAIAAHLKAGHPFAHRLAMGRALAERDKPLDWQECDFSAGTRRITPADPAAWGDVILARKETPTSYHLSVVVDDALQGVTHVVRGEDLLAATAIHRLLQELLGLPQPLYQHHRLILAEDGRKLSKSAASTSLRALREQGATPADIRKMVGL